MMKYLDEHPDINQVWVYELSRIGRSMDDTAAVIKMVVDRGVGVFSLSEPFLNVEDAHMRKFLLCLLGLQRMR